MPFWERMDQWDSSSWWSMKQIILNIFRIQVRLPGLVPVAGRVGSSQRQVGLCENSFCAPSVPIPGLEDLACSQSNVIGLGWIGLHCIALGWITAMCPIWGCLEDHPEAHSWELPCVTVLLCKLHWLPIAFWCNIIYCYQHYVALQGQFICRIISSLRLNYLPHWLW